MALCDQVQTPYRMGFTHLHVLMNTENFPKKAEEVPGFQVHFFVIPYNKSSH